MPTVDPRIDDYIANARPFAQPILTHLREIVHSACPDAEEAVKWGAPFFMYKGQMLCQMAAFKEHVSFGFWKAKMMDSLNKTDASEAAGQFGRITTVKDLPSKKVMTGFIKEAMKLNDEGITAARTVRRKADIPVPEELEKALAKNKKAKATFDAFPPGHRREYNEWIAEAKREETRIARAKQAVEWIAEGKQRNWKYQR